MKTLSIFGIIFSLICLGCSVYMMNAQCNCPPAENASLYFNDTEPVGAFGSGLINLFVSIFFLTFSIITAVIFFGSKTERTSTTAANWQPATITQPQAPQPQPNYNWQPANYPPPPQNQQWAPPPPQTPPVNPQWTPPPPPPNQQIPQTPPPPPGWQQPPANDDLNRWAPKRDNPPHNTPPAN